MLVNGSKLNCISFLFSGKCKPHCHDKCMNGTCTRPDTCSCNFGYVGKQCEKECKCYGNSNCPNEMGLTDCLKCMNHTKVSPVDRKRGKKQCIMQMQSGNSKLAINCFGFYAVSAIFQPCNGLSWLLNIWGRLEFEFQYFDLCFEKKAEIITGFS